MLSRLKIYCRNKQHGCSMITTLESEEQHSKNCEYDNERMLECIKGCGMLITKAQERMRVVLNVTKSIINGNSCNYRSMVDSRSNQDAGDLYLTETDQEELQIWASSLPEATVTQWGGMISTPDPGLQTSIRRALIECGCPAIHADLLIDRSHERRWPSGLATLDVRQSNRSRYANYICRRIPGKQAVVIFWADNVHMPREMICSPGIIMIFAHGLEST